jgi:6-phosphofructokinase
VNIITQDIDRLRITAGSHSRIFIVETMGRKFGIGAVDMIANEDFGRMVAWKQGEVRTVPIRKALEQLNLVNVEKFYNTKDYRSRDQVL